MPYSQDIYLLRALSHGHENTWHGLCLILCDVCLEHRVRVRCSTKINKASYSAIMMLAAIVLATDTDFCRRSQSSFCTTKVPGPERELQGPFPGGDSSLLQADRGLANRRRSMFPPRDFGVL